MITSGYDVSGFLILGGLGEKFRNSDTCHQILLHEDLAHVSPSDNEAEKMQEIDTR
jgi:hypothetical protein